MSSLPADQYLCSASQEDVPSIIALLSHYSSMGALLPRSEQDVIDNIDNFLLIKKKEGVIACGSLEHFSDELAEIRSLMVKPHLKGLGHGKILVTKIIQLARERNVERLMALTYTAGFFHTLGFQTVDKSIFPEKIWGICVHCYKFNNCDETAVLLHL